MKRLFWLSVGAGAGVYATRRVSRFVHSWSPEGIAARAGGAGDRLRLFGSDVLVGMREREQQLREAVELDRSATAIEGGRGGSRRVLRAPYTVVDTGDATSYHDHDDTDDKKDGH